MPLKFGLPSTRAGGLPGAPGRVGVAACPDVRVIDSVMMALTAAAAAPTETSELTCRMCIRASFYWSGFPSPPTKSVALSLVSGRGPFPDA